MYSKTYPLVYSCLFLLSLSCSSPPEKPLRHLEDIRFDQKIDKKDFPLCDENKIYQYFNLGDNIHYEGDKPAIINAFKEKYDESLVKSESGLIRVRFVVNCHGDADRFRLIQSDLNYQEKIFDKNITDQIMAITRSLDKWGLKLEDSGDPVDYYQYLIFKIIDGKINKILP